MGTEKSSPQRKFPGKTLVIPASQVYIEVVKLKCILIDHDDTSVDSTPQIHHPAHLEQMRRLGRHEESKSLEDWFRMNYDPGIHHYLGEVLKLSPREEKICYGVWRSFTAKTDPPFFPGIVELLSDFTDSGGIVAVVSHSEADIISDHYERQMVIPGFRPHEIFGWNGDPSRNKPSVWPVEEIRRRHRLDSGEMLMIDDLRPGIEMARNAGVRSLGAGWSHDIGEIHDMLRREADLFFDSVDEAIKWIRNAAGNP